MTAYNYKRPARNPAAQVAQYHPMVQIEPLINISGPHPHLQLMVESFELESVAVVHLLESTLIIIPIEASEPIIGE